MKFLLLSSLLVLSISTYSWSQNIATSTIKWNSIQTFNPADGSVTEEETHLISYGKTKLEWKEMDGSIRKSFQVIEVIGDWANVNNTGHMVYEVKEGQYTGTITFRKTATETQVLITIVSDDARMTELKIQNTQIL